MAGYFIVDVRTRTTIAICAVITLFMFGIGIIIGYFAGRNSNVTQEPCLQQSVESALRATCNTAELQSPTVKKYFDRYLERHNEKHACVSNAHDCNKFGQPRNYIAYHLDEKNITIDGKLDDEAWNEVPWSENFVDMRSGVYPAPYLDTKFKIRWDDERLYVGVYIQENNLWANQTNHDSNVWTDNAVEMLIDVDGTLFNYKQIQINVIGTILDQLVYKSPYDANKESKVIEKEWNSFVQKGIYAEGTINKPGDFDKFWSAELSVSFKALANNSAREYYQPIENEVWFMQFGRSEQSLVVNKNGVYERKPKSTTNWWAWQACDTINLHLQDRWGLVLFQRGLQHKEFGFMKWHIYKSLFDVRDAMRKYIAVHGKYVDTIEELDVPPYLLTEICVEVPVIRLVKRGNATDFDVTVRSKLIYHNPAHIREDRYVSFSTDRQ